MPSVLRYVFAASLKASALWVWFWPAVVLGQTDALLDFRFFNAPQDARWVLNPMQIRWLVRPDAQTYCQSAEPKDGHASRQEGCAYWQLAMGQCTLVTTDFTTHSQLGHLYLHCLRGQ